MFKKYLRSLSILNIEDNKQRYVIIFLIYGLVFISFIYGQNLEEYKSKQGKKPLLKDAFIERIAIKFDQKSDDLQPLRRKGYGKVEIIKLVLISQKSNQPLKELVKKRDKNERLTKIAQEYNLDYKQINLEAYEIKEEIETSLFISSTTYKHSLIKNTTEVINK